MENTFEHYIEGRPDFALLTVKIPSGQTLKVEASAMATMDTNLKMKTKMKGGFGRLFTGESIFINDFTAENGAAEIKIAPSAPGDLIHNPLNGSETMYLQSSAFVASAPSVTVNSKWQGFKGFFSGAGLFLAQCTGSGDLWFNSFGGVIEIDVKDSYVVDTGNIVAFSGNLNYSVTRFGGYKSLFFSGVGLVCRFQGEGKVWIQTRKIGPLTSWAHPFRPEGKN